MFLPDTTLFVPFQGIRIIEKIAQEKVLGDTVEMLTLVAPDGTKAKVNRASLTRHNARLPASPETITTARASLKKRAKPMTGHWNERDKIIMRHLSVGTPADHALVVRLLHSLHIGKILAARLARYNMAMECLVQECVYVEKREPRIVREEIAALLSNAHFLDA